LDALQVARSRQTATKRRSSRPRPETT
jgi:hypothetical protein